MQNNTNKPTIALDNTPVTCNLFPHRFDAAKAHDPLNVQDAFNAMAARAQGVLMLLFSQFQFEGESRMSDEIILNSIDAVFHDIKDMKAVMKAHFEAVKVTRDGAS
jgi:hypothetical protein